MKFRLLVPVVLLAWTSVVRSDFIFTSQPINGHVMWLWLGISPEYGSANRQIDMSNPAWRSRTSHVQPV